MELLDVLGRFEKHADTALKSTIGPIPMEEFFRDAKLCPPSPDQHMPNVLDDAFKDLIDTPEEDDMQHVIVSYPCFMIKHSP